MNRALTICITIFCLLGAVSAQARVNIGYTPEWMAHDADLIIEGVPLSVRVDFYSGDVWFTKVKLRVTRIVKGPLTVDDEITIWDHEGKDLMGIEKAIGPKRTLLIFAKIAKNTFPEMDGRYTFVHYPSKQATFFTDQKLEKVYAEDCSRIEDYGNLLSRAGAQVTKEYELGRRFWKGTIVMKKIEAPTSSHAFDDLYGGSAVFVPVPEYKEP
ncbi:MAG: hypothetical protein V4819_18370 [Verrucomicrobiota bacterium]